MKWQHQKILKLFAASSMPFSSISMASLQITDYRKCDKRRGWDLNPRWSYPHSGFRDRPVQPLQHLSVSKRRNILLRVHHSFGFSLSETELMQYRNPVGFGPSGNTWPRCAPQALQIT